MSIKLGLTDLAGTIPIDSTPTEDSNNAVSSGGTYDFVLSQIAGLGEVMVFKGVVNSNSSLPASHQAGWTYKVGTAGTYAGVVCEVGDTIVCIDSGTVASDADWYVLQANIDGAVTGPVSATNGHLPVFNGTTGKILQDGYGVDTTITDSSTTIPTTAAVYAAIQGAIGGSY